MTKKIKDGPYVDYYSDGDRKDREEVTYKNGVQEGPYVYYYSGEFEGNRKEGTYKNGVIEGPGVFYYRDKHREQSTYKNGVKEGPYLYYYTGLFHEDGDREEGTYKNGVKEGPYVGHFSRSIECKDREEGTYKNGVKEGPYIYYFSGRYEGDRQEGIFKNEIKEGPFVDYFFNGDQQKGTYKNGVEEGLYVCYHSDGRITKGNKNHKKDMELDYDNPKYSNQSRPMEETKKYYYETGELKKEIEYRRNGEIILYSTYHINGQLECRSRFFDGKKDGITEIYHSNGQLESNIEYLNDIPFDGPYTIFLDDGSIWEKGIFKNLGQEMDISIKGGKPFYGVLEIKEDTYKKSDIHKI